LKWVTDLLFKNQKVASDIFVASFFINLFGLASAIYVMQVYGRYLMHGIDTTLITLFSGMVIVIALEFTLKGIRFNIVSKLIKRRDTEQNKGRFNSLLNIRADEFIQIKDSIKRVILNRSDEMYNTLNTPLFISIIDTPFAFLYISAIFFISTYVGWVVLGLTIFTLIITYLRSIKIGTHTKELIKANTKKQSFSLSIEHTEMLKTNNTKNTLSSMYENSAIEASRVKNIIQKEQNTLQYINQNMTMFLSAIVIAIGASEVVNGNIDFGMLIGINILATRAMGILTRPVSSMATMLKQKDTEEFLEKFSKLREDKQDGIKIKDFDSNITVKDMVFGYGQGPIIQNLNVNIKKGSLVKIVGSNGAGKTTLCRLLTGMYEPRMGHIVVDGVDLRQVDSKWWNEQISYIPQEPEFINSTIKENIVLEKDIDDVKLNQIIQEADLENYINLSADGVSMDITNSGKNLPVGVRRRLSIARAIANDGSIVIVDEPSDGLDQKGIEAIANYVNRSLQNNKTVIIATHAMNLMNNEKILINLNSKIPQVTYYD
jgi:ATP-binding cassette subfamily C protein LapB